MDRIYDFTPEDDMLVYREKSDWDVPYKLYVHDVNISVVLDKKYTYHLFHSTMLKYYTRPIQQIQYFLNLTIRIKLI